MLKPVKYISLLSITTACKDTPQSRPNTANQAQSSARVAARITEYPRLENKEANGFGGAISNAHDIDGDGFSDLVVGAYNTAPGGTSFVYFGNGSGFSHNNDSLQPDPEGTGSFGLFVCSGDINGDGLTDFSIGSPYENEQHGAIYTYFGNNDRRTIHLEYSYFNASNESLGLGWGLACNSDINNDNFDDVIIGNSNSNGLEAVYIVYGSLSGIDQAYDILYSPLSPESNFEFGLGTINSGGDANGDGIDDIIIGADATDMGAYQSVGLTYVVYGTSSDSEYEIQTLSASDFQEAGHYGCATAIDGDINGDGYDDVLVGKSHDSTNNPYGGAAYVYYGSSTGVREDSEFKLYSPSRNTYQDFFGGALDIIEDIDQDGFDDLAISTGSGDGEVFIFYGATTGVVTSIHTHLTATSVHGMGVGVTGLDDFNSDGYPDLAVGASRPAFEGGQVLFFTGGSQDNDHDGVVHTEDCDDDDASIGLPATLYDDADGDGFGDPTTAGVEGCPSAGLVWDSGDCDDTRADLSPDAPEVCGDEIDNNCDGFGLLTDDEDGDGLSSEEEAAIGTDPCNPDTDGDGVSDGDEVLAGTDPLSPPQDSGAPDTDDSGTHEDLTARCGCREGRAAWLVGPLLLAIGRRRKPLR